MTRKDYVLLADAFRKAYQGTTGYDGFVAGIDTALAMVVEALEADNPRFNYGRFYDAIFPESVTNP